MQAVVKENPGHYFLLFKPYFAVFEIIMWVILMDSLEFLAHRNSKKAIKNILAQREGTDIPDYKDAKLLVGVFSPTRLWRYVATI